MQKFRQLFVGFFAVFISLFLVMPSFSQEVIRSFFSDVILNVDGSVNVIEKISVRVEGKKIKRGIYRDIPTVLINDDGSKLRSKFRVISVQKNGNGEPFKIAIITNGKRIYIGEENVFLEPGIYNYEIAYSMSRMARRFEKYDEIFWNATGSFWDFPIEKAVAKITLPDGAVISDFIGFVGKKGSTELGVKVINKTPNSATFRATRPLAAYEGMSVAIKFQKGVLLPPSTADYLSDRLETIVPILSVFLVFFYYFFTWRKVGRDPKKGVIIPLFYPPKDFSPALVHYIHKMGWRKDGWTAFSAALINLGAKGLITIDKKKNSTKISLSENQPDKLPIGEEIIYDLIKSKNPLFLNKANGKKISAAKESFTALLGVENRHAYFKLNIVYAVFGFIMSLILLVILVFIGSLNPAYLFGSIMIGIIGAIFSSLFGGNLAKAGNSRFIILAWVLIIGLNLAGTISVSVTNSTINLAFFAAISIVLINIFFASIMRVSTIHGRKIMDQIDGFKMYLETAEKERLNMFDEPQMSVSRFETILPYAIALGVEKPWAKHFENELARNAVVDAQIGYQPNWYRATNFSTSNLTKSMASMASGMSASMIASMPVSSSSSGFSGGGSGGGGGGGGGGGW